MYNSKCVSCHSRTVLRNALLYAKLHSIRFQLSNGWNGNEICNYFGVTLVYWLMVTPDVNISINWVKHTQELLFSQHFWKFKIISNQTFKKKYFLNIFLKADSNWNILKMRCTYFEGTFCYICDYRQIRQASWNAVENRINNIFDYLLRINTIHIYIWCHIHKSYKYYIKFVYLLMVLENKELIKSKRLAFVTLVTTSLVQC